MVICMSDLLFASTCFYFSDSPRAINTRMAKLTFPGEAGPFAGLATVIGLAWFGMILYSDALISPFSGIVFVFSSARASYSMSKSGHMPVFFKSYQEVVTLCWA